MKFAFISGVFFFSLISLLLPRVIPKRINSLEYTTISTSAAMGSDASIVYSPSVASITSADPAVASATPAASVATIFPASNAAVTFGYDGNTNLSITAECILNIDCQPDEVCRNGVCIEARIPVDLDTLPICRVGIDNHLCRENLRGICTNQLECAFGRRCNHKTHMCEDQA